MSEQDDAMRAHYLLLWKYERWANDQWLQALPSFKDQAESNRIFRHIIGCYADWAMDVNPDFKMTEEELVIPDSMEGLYELWEAVSARWPLADVAETGPGGHLTFGEIVQHVLNHSTYHRGQLRGLAQAEGREDFPETDFARWALRHRD